MLQLGTPAICKAKRTARGYLERELPPPYSNTGVVLSEIPFRPDWVSFRIHESVLPKSPETLSLALYQKMATRGLLVDGGYSITTVEGGFNGFKHGRHLKCGEDLRASVQWGGLSQRGWVSFEIRGGMCPYLTRREWFGMFCWIVRCGDKARLGRLDLALDDLGGKLFSVDGADAQYKLDPSSFLPEHRLGSPRPARKRIDSDDGSTLYVGARTASVRHTVYEKGRQLAHKIQGKRYPDWVRWEVCFKRAKGAELDPLLLHPDYWASFAVGSSKYLAQLWDRNGCRATWSPGNVFEEPQEKLAKALLTLRRQYGAVFHHLRRLMPLETILDTLAREPKEPCGLEGLRLRDIPAVFEKLQELGTSGVCASSTAGQALDDMPSW